MAIKIVTLSSKPDETILPQESAKDKKTTFLLPFQTHPNR